MKLSQFKFELPSQLIAQEPLKTRHESRLLVVDRKTQKIEHRTFHDVLDIFNEDDVFVVNNTKVFTARMYGQKEKTGAQIEVFLLRELNHDLRLWDVLVDPARKIRVGNKLYFGEDDLVAEPRYNATITELIYVPNSLQDGIYFMQLGLPRIFSDAVPSNPILYPLIKKD